MELVKLWIDNPQTLTLQCWKKPKSLKKFSKTIVIVRKKLRRESPFFSRFWIFQKDFSWVEFQHEKLFAPFSLELEKSNHSVLCLKVIILICIFLILHKLKWVLISWAVAVYMLLLSIRHMKLDSIFTPLFLHQTTSSKWSRFRVF